MFRDEDLRRNVWAVREDNLASHADGAAIRFGLGHLQALAARQAATFREAEFRTYSQFGEDGIIQWLIAHVPIEREAFVEFGVGDYRESNTRFLLEHDYWEGLILDAGDAHIKFVSSSEMHWKYPITTAQAFITRENIDELLAPMAGDIGLLSIDLDGNDYWIWEATTVLQPRIVVCEYNGVLDTGRPVAVPYDPAFNRERAHFSWLYWGASLAALTSLARRKGYRLVGSNRQGHNAFFVRDDVASDVPKVGIADVWVASRYRESRDEHGAFTYISRHAERRRRMAEMPIVDVETGERLTVGDL